MSVPTGTADAEHPKGLAQTPLLGYTARMKNSETSASASSYIGHVKNGVVVLDAHVDLADGQTVRVEPLGPEGTTLIRNERVAQLQQMQELFSQWDEEDSQISTDDAESFHNALKQNRGLCFRTPKMD